MVNRSRLLATLSILSALVLLVAGSGLPADLFYEDLWLGLFMGNVFGGLATVRMVTR